MPANVLVAVVDDDESAREAIVGLVRGLGYKAQGFASGKDFLFSAARQQVACLVTDMRMPDMTGLELHDRLSATGVNIPAILVSSYEDDALVARAMKAGVMFCLSKPLDPEELHRCLRAATGTGG